MGVGLRLNDFVCNLLGFESKHVNMAWGIILCYYCNGRQMEVTSTSSFFMFVCETCLVS